MHTCIQMEEERYCRLITLLSILMHSSRVWLIYTSEGFVRHERNMSAGTVPCVKKSSGYSRSPFSPISRSSRVWNVLKENLVDDVQYLLNNSNCNLTPIVFCFGSQSFFFPPGVPHNVADRLHKFRDCILPFQKSWNWWLCRCGPVSALNPLPFTISLTYVQEPDRMSGLEAIKQEVKHPSGTESQNTDLVRPGMDHAWYIAQRHGSRCDDGWISLMRHDVRHAAM